MPDPTLGRIVHYVEQLGPNQGLKCRAAVVSDADSSHGDILSLHVFRPGGAVTVARIDKPDYNLPGQSVEERVDRGTWHWPRECNENP